MQLIVTVAAVAVAACATIFTAWTVREHRNADLVKVGVSVLAIDPEKEKQISSATREWALNLIDANAGGVKFSPEARAKLLREPLKYDYGYDTSWDTGSFGTQFESKRPRPAPEPPK